MEIDLKKMTIEQTHEALKEGKCSVRELVQASLDAITKEDSRVHAFLEVFADTMQQADAAQKRFSEGTATMLTGIPIAIKDNILIKGRKVSAASKLLENYTATYDATVISKLKEAGVVFMGRTNMDEFAMGGSTENSAYGVTKNPHDDTRVAGGTSGGSAAAVAAGMVLGALGSDTGGSIRQPAAFCGVVGVKPSYDTVSRSGLIADTSSFDQIGPLAKTVRDAEIILATIVGKDSLDATSEVLDTALEMPKSLKIGVPRNFLSGDGIDPELLANFTATIEKLKLAGHTIVDVSVPLLEYSLAVYYILQPAEVSSNLARFDGMRYGLSVPGSALQEVYAKTRGAGFGKEVRRRVLLGTYVLSHGYYDAYYRKADALRNEIKKSFATAFDTATGGVDVILTPTTPSPAFKIGEKINDPVAMYLEDIFTVPLNIASIPGISIPCGTSTSGLPLGLQIIGARGSDSMLLSIGKAFEQIVQ